MCGINGFFKFHTFVQELNRDMLITMNARMHYRGPDEQDIWSNERAGLAQVRLSIIGVSNGHQPILNEDKTLVIICNGEIYNYKELREELKLRGHIFSTESDTEVILHLFEEKGEECLHDLRGMYAFAIYDIKKEQLFLARDTSGKKPLYYTITPHGLVFSSELTAIKEAFSHFFEPDWGCIQDCLKYSYPQQLTDTYIKQIKRLQPAECAWISKEGFRSKRYWKKQNKSSFPGSYAAAKAKTLEVLREAVHLRLRSDVPVAILLSGGIDSGAIAALASETHSNIHTITVGYKGSPECDERLLAKRLAKEKGLIWHELELDETDYAAYFNEYLSHIDEPICDAAAIAQWGIYKKAKQLGFKVLLTGCGGDELFFGYPSHNETGEYIDFLQNLIKLPIKKRLSFLVKNYRTALSVLKGYQSKPFGGFHFSSYAELDHTWSNSNDFSHRDVYKDYYNEECSGVDKVYNYLFNVWLPNNCYYLSDKLGMGNSLEVRAPFADRKLIEFTSTLPLDYRYHKGRPKQFLKDTLRGVLPDYILDAPKRGFTPPSNFLNNLVKAYQPAFFKSRLHHYNQVVVDAFLKQKIYHENSRPLSHL